jgi:hypothetical protein
MTAIPMPCCLQAFTVEAVAYKESPTITTRTPSSCTLRLTTRLGVRTCRMPRGGRRAPTWLGYERPPVQVTCKLLRQVQVQVQVQVHLFADP